jgi:hypothetical protein
MSVDSAGVQEAYGLKSGRDRHERGGLANGLANVLVVA